MTLTLIPFLQFLSSLSFSACRVGSLFLTILFIYINMYTMNMNVLLSLLSQGSHTRQGREAWAQKNEERLRSYELRSWFSSSCRLTRKHSSTLLLMTRSPFEDREELCSCGWHIRIDLILHIYIHCSNVWVWMNEGGKNRVMKQEKHSYFPTTLNIFSIFWWEWSSGRFSAITVRSCTFSS